MTRFSVVSAATSCALTGPGLRDTLKEFLEDVIREEPALGSKTNPLPFLVEQPAIYKLAHGLKRARHRLFPELCTKFPHGNTPVQTQAEEPCLLVPPLR